MAAFPFVGPSYMARSRTFDAQRCVNLYPELSGSDASKGPAALIGTPGLVTWAVIGAGPVRAMLRFSASLAVVMSGQGIYTVTPAGVVVLLGTIDDAAGPQSAVSMASNGAQVAIATGGGLYFVDPVTGVIETAAYTADVVAFVDGYFVFNESGTGRFRITDLYATTITGTDFATAEGSPDHLLALVTDHRELWLLGESSTEVWFDSGNSDFPFERIQGAFLEVGCAAPHSVVKLDGSVFWLGADERGQGIVLRAQGYQPRRVSTHAIEFAIGQYSRIDDAIAFGYQQEGHSFYVLTFPTADATWVYDASTGMWHERAWRDVDGALRRHRGNCHMAFDGRNLVGDWETGRIYALDLDTYTDDGAQIARIRQCPHASADLKRVFIAALQVDMETGVGLSSGQGSDPQAMLQWSNDGGFTWSSEMWTSFGRIGERRARARWRRLGNARDRVFRVTITDPVKIAIVGASAELAVAAT